MLNWFVSQHATKHHAGRDRTSSCVKCNLVFNIRPLFLIYSVSLEYLVIFNMKLQNLNLQDFSTHLFEIRSLLLNIYILYL